DVLHRHPISLRGRDQALKLAAEKMVSSSWTCGESLRPLPQSARLVLPWSTVASSSAMCLGVSSRASCEARLAPGYNLSHQVAGIFTHLVIPPLMVPTYVGGDHAPPEHSEGETHARSPHGKRVVDRRTTISPGLASRSTPR